MLTSFGPFTLTAYWLQWNLSPVITNNGYTLNLYDGGGPLTFQAVLSSGVPCAGNPNGNMTDVQSIINEALGAALASTDMNGDGVVNAVDVQFVLNAVLGCGANTGQTNSMTSLTSAFILGGVILTAIVSPSNTAGTVTFFVVVS